MKFIRQDAHKKSKLKKVWRRPRGWQNKVRLQKKGYRRMPKPGMGTPNNEKHKIGGKELIRVSSIAELANAKGKIVTLAAIGMKKKIMIIEEGIKQKIEFSFDAQKVLSSFNKEIQERKKLSEEVKKVKEEKKAVKKVKEEKSEETAKEAKEEKTDEEKKKELDKELIHRK